jgi:hypothetical protein
MSLALALAVPLAWRRFGAIVPWMSVARGLVLAALLVFVGSRFHASGVRVILKGLSLAAGAVVLLFAAGEIRLPGRPGRVPEAA